MKKKLFSWVVFRNYLLLIAVITLVIRVSFRWVLWGQLEKQAFPGVFLLFAFWLSVTFLGLAAISSSFWRVVKGRWGKSIVMNQQSEDGKPYIDPQIPDFKTFQEQ